MVIGGQAVNAHGHSRFTKDVDFTIDLGPWDLDIVLDIASRTKLNVECNDPQQFVDLTQVLPCTAAYADLGVDFSFVPSPYIKQAIARGVWFDVGGRPVRFLAIEDLLLQKVIANRPQDRIDVVELLVRHGDADFEYIRQWLREFEDVTDEQLIERFEALHRESTQ